MGRIYFGVDKYQNDELGKLWHRLPDRSRRLTFKVNPLNLQSIKVVHPVESRVIPVDCVSDVQWPRTLAYHLAVRAQARRTNLNPDDVRDLTEAQRLLQQSFARAIESRRALRHLQAQLLKESQQHDWRAVDDDIPLTPVAGHEEVAAAFADVFSEQDASQE